MAKFPCPRRLFARRRGGSAGYGCRTPFFPRILEHLVRLGFRPGDDPGRPRRRLGEALEPVPEGEQVLAVAPEFAGQPGGRGALPDAPEDEYQLGRGAVGLLERGGGVGVEYRPAPALVVEDRRAVPVVDPQPIGPTAPGAPEPTRVEEVQEEPVAGVRVHQIDDREVHPWASGSQEVVDAESKPPAPSPGTPTHS